MHRVIGMILCLSFFVPQAAFAAEDSAPPISRRDGFLLMWEAIRRPVLENREKPFSDVSKASRGFEEITYAKYRGLIDDDEENFRPDEPLLSDDALLWLFRTRSVDDIDELTEENLPSLLERYPLNITISPSHHLSESDIFSLMQSLDNQLATEDHEVSLYSEKFHGDGTAFGETFDMHAMTAAHRTFPHNTLVKVTNIRNGKAVTVRINDRGPFVEGRDMDLSLAAFTSIEDRSKGILRATFQRLGDATLVDQCRSEDIRRAVRIAGNVRLIGGIPVTFVLGGTLVLRSPKSFVIREIRYPDGQSMQTQDWILPEEQFSFTPSIEGQYVFVLGTREGRTRELGMQAVSCM